MSAERNDALSVRILQALGGLQCLQLDMLAKRTATAPERLNSKLDRLLRRGRVARLSRGCYMITAAGREALAAGTAAKPGPAKGTPARPVAREDSFRSRIWHALRVKNRPATAAELARMAKKPGERAAKRNARSYLSALVRAGLVARDGGARPVYTLVRARDPGPLAPIYQESRGRLWDPNARRPLEFGVLLDEHAARAKRRPVHGAAHA